jgi:selenoprotein W-related protein
LTEKIAHDYKNRLARVSLVPSSGGVFEVRLNGRDIYSKKATGRFPDQNQIVAQIGTLLPSDG